MFRKTFDRVWLLVALVGMGALSLVAIWKILVLPAIVMNDRKEVVCYSVEHRSKRVDFTCTDSATTFGGSTNRLGTDPGGRSVTVWVSRRFPGLHFVPKEIQYYWLFLGIFPAAFGAFFVYRWIRSRSGEGASSSWNSSRRHRG